MSNKIRRLKDTYKANDIIWRIVERTDTKAIAVKTTGNESYEVFKIKVGAPFELYGKSEYDLVETIPKNEDFGKLGWSFGTKLQAYQAYTKLS